VKSLFPDQNICAIIQHLLFQGFPLLLPPKALTMVTPPPPPGIFIAWTLLPVPCSLLSAFSSLLSVLHSFREISKKSDFYSAISIINIPLASYVLRITINKFRFTALFVSFSIRGTNIAYRRGFRP
jgi:hypothetical protein